MNNLFIGVQWDMTPIAPSLETYLDKHRPWNRCIVRAPMGLKLTKRRPLQFTDVLTEATLHLVGESEYLDDVTFFIGSPDLVNVENWREIADVVDIWQEVGVKSLCFEAMTQWNAQFNFAYECCRIAGIRVMLEGIPRHGVTPLDAEILLMSHRYVNHFRRGNLSENYKYNVIVRRDALQFAGVFKGLFGKAPETLDELQLKLEETGAEVFRYPEVGTT